MTPRSPLVPVRMAPRASALGMSLVLVVLACVAFRAAGADPAPVDSVAARGGGASPATAPSPPFHPPEGGLFRADRVAHASLAFAIGTGVGLSSREPAAGAGAVLVLAVAKELLDPRLDRGDLAAGAVGAGLAWLLVAALTR